MAERRVIAGVLLLGVVSGCSEGGQGLVLGGLCTDGGEYGYLGPLCTTSGDVTVVAGLTGDAKAYRFGPGTGELNIRLSPLVGFEPNGAFFVDVLALSSRSEGSTLFRTMTWGSCTACPDDPSDLQVALTDEPVWAPAVSPVLGVAGAPEDALITLRGADLDIVELRTSTDLWFQW